MAIADEDLITRVLLRDDRNAFATLVRRYQSLVRNMLRKLTRGDLELADDLAQETFIKAYRGLSKFRGQAKFSTWLYRIAYNEFASNNRSKKEFIELDEAVTENKTEVKSIDLEQDLHAAMQSLTNNERVAIEFCYKSGFSHSEAAEVLGQPIGTIKTHIARGKEKLRRVLAPWKESICYE